VAPVVVRDVGAAWSPDGRFIAFESSRGRSAIGESSLWMIPARSGQTPRRITFGDGTDRDACWTPDGTALIYAAIARSGDNFDLWRLPVRFEGERPVPGTPVRLTSTPENELYPSVSPDGRYIVYQRATDADGSTIWRMPIAGGPAERLTAGPADLTPAYSPDGAHLAFARGRYVALPEGAPGPRTRLDIDLYQMPAAGGEATLVIAEPYADQLGPRWDREGRLLFATSVYRAVDDDQPVLSSVTFVDLWETPLVLRALHDPAVVATRSGVAITPRESPNAGVLGRLRPYVEALLEVMQDQLREREEAATEDPPPG
jgi:Tol biopolymer transport system component